MEIWAWFLIAAIVIVAVAVVLVLLRVRQRSGTVVAARPSDGGQQAAGQDRASDRGGER